MTSWLEQLAKTAVIEVRPRDNATIHKIAVQIAVQVMHVRYSVCVCIRVCT